jgi:hypothetical protein
LWKEKVLKSKLIEFLKNIFTYHLKFIIMKKLVLLFAAVFAMTLVSCETKPASASDASANASTSAPASTENVQSAPEASTSAVASENKDAEVSENKDAAAPVEEKASAEQKEESKPAA